jgi:hypothetical protein
MAAPLVDDSSKGKVTSFSGTQCLMFMHVLCALFLGDISGLELAVPFISLLD